MKTSAALLTLVILALGAPLSARADTWGEPINTPDRFVVLSSFNNQAVFDKETGLVWEQSPDTTAESWFVAQARCNDRTRGNRKGWRLPTIQELASLVDPTVPTPSPTLPAGHPFNNVQSSNYWSATTLATFADFTWGVHFGVGGVVTHNKTGPLFVWCVRGGQGVDPQ